MHFDYHLSFITCCAQPAFIKDSLDKYIDREMKRWNIPGAAVAIVQDGKVVVMKSNGVREIGKTDKVDENTLWASLITPQM